MNLSFVNEKSVVGIRDSLKVINRILSRDSGL